MVDLPNKFKIEFAYSILDGIATINTIDLPEGFFTQAVDLIFEFNDEVVPAELQGQFTVTIMKGIKDA